MLDSPAPGPVTTASDDRQPTTFAELVDRLRGGERVADEMIRAALAEADREIGDLAAALLATAAAEWRCECGERVRVYSTRPRVHYGRCVGCGKRLKRVRATA